MATVNSPYHSNRRDVSEWEQKVECAAVCRLLALRGWSDMAEQFVAVRLKSRDRTFLMYPYGTFMEEVRASDICTWGFDDSNSHQNGTDLNPGTHNVTVGVFDARPDVNCVVHLHTRPIVGVSVMKEGLMPLCHPSFLIRRRLAYVDYIADEEGSGDFRIKHAKRVGTAKVVIARNHGAYIYASCGYEAYFLAHNLMQACETQLDACATGRPISVADGAREAEIFEELDRCLDQGYTWDGAREWDGLIRKLDRECPCYKD